MLHTAVQASSYRKPFKSMQACSTLMQRMRGMRAHSSENTRTHTHTHTHTHTLKSKQACIIHTVTEWNDVWVRAAVSCGPAAKHNKTNNDYIPLWPIVAHFPFSSPPTSRSAFMMRGSDLEPVGVTHPWCILLMSWARDLPTFYVPPAT